MRLVKVFILVFILAFPIGVSSVVHYIDDEQTCEMLESFGEEEEGDDTKGKDFEETEILKNYYVTKIKHYKIEDHSVKTYASHNELHHAIVMEVQTPPPENTMC
jgi:hypothetical protein